MVDWLPLFDAAFVALVVLYAPGLLFVRACRFTWLASFVVAPVMSSFLYLLIGAVLAGSHIPISGCDLFIAVSCLCVALFSISVLLYQIAISNRRYHPVSRSFARNEFVPREKFIASFFPDSIGMWALLILYIVIGAAVSSFVFLNGIESPDGFSREWDAAYHYTAIRSYLDDGLFSIFDSRTYADIPESGNFYPALWHITVAVVADISGEQLTICANAVIVIALSLLLPSGVFGIFSCIFKKTRLLLVLGCVLPLAFSAYPWGNLIFGQLVSNFYSNALLFSVIVFLIVLMVSFRAKSLRVICIILFLCSCIALVGAQPNSVFTLCIFATFYFMHVWVDCVEASSKFKKKSHVKIAGCLTIFAISCLLWFAAFLIPLIQDISTLNDAASYDLWDAIANCAVFSFSRDRLYPQFFLSLICWIGFFFALSKKTLRWICGPYAIAFFIFVVSASCNGLFCHFVSGFWYNDIYRTGAIVCIFALPLAAIGMHTIFYAIDHIIAVFMKGKNALKIIKVVLTLTLIVLFVPLNYLLSIPYSPEPDKNINSFERVNQLFHTWYSWDSDYLFNSSQYEFVKKANEIVKKDPGLIMNVIHDGSGWMYGVEGLNVMYRGWQSPSSSVIDAPLLRNQLNKIASSREVRRCAREFDVKYVLRLSPSNSKSNPDYIYGLYKPEDWKGVNRITDKTAGFKPILKDGDMRLYKIVDERKS